MKSRLSRIVAVVAALGVAAGAYVYLGHPLVPAARAASEPLPPTPATAAPAAPLATRTLPDFSAIVQRYGSAVVNVSTVGTMKNVSAQPGEQNDPFWQFFHQFGAPAPRGNLITHGIGSGFIINSDGIILTNAHVVAGANEVTVKLTDKREYRAKVIGMDKDTDVAVLKINAKNLPTVKIGDPSKVKVGEWVLAIGSPFGFDNSVTAGVVSARARSLPGDGYVPFLQTDVPVNPGNSGGPLFDLAGDVIGINSQIYTGTGGYMGISFAIPINVAMNVEQQILAHGKVVRGRLGVTVQDVNQQLADSFDLSQPTGALVSSVQKGGPAARAGLQPGDVILSLDGKPVNSSTDLPPRVADIKPGTMARLEIWRDHHQSEVDVKIGAMKDNVIASATNQGEARGRLGIAVRPLTPQEQRQDDVHGGVLVEDVTGPAAAAGVQPGDVVLAVNGTPVKQVDQLRTLVSKAHDHVALLIQRGNEQIFVPVDLG